MPGADGQEEHRQQAKLVVKTLLDYKIYKWEGRNAKNKNWQSDCDGFQAKNCNEGKECIAVEGILFLAKCDELGWICHAVAVDSEFVYIIGVDPNRNLINLKPWWKGSVFPGACE